MLRKLCTIVLLGLTLMAMASPLLQLDSLDSFPVSSSDFELLVMFCFCVLGMTLVFPRLSKLILICVRTTLPPVPSVLRRSLLLIANDSNVPVSSTAGFPLRI